MLSGCRPKASLSSKLHSFFLCRFREARAALRNARVLPAAPPTYFFLSVRLRTGIGICSPACSVVTNFVLVVCLVYIYFYIHSCLSVSLSHSRLCVEGPCPCESTLARSGFPSPFSLALRYKTPEVPPHSTHPRGIPRQRTYPFKLTS